MTSTTTTTPVDDLDIPFVSLGDPDFLADPFGTWERHRHSTWLVRSEMGLNVLPYQANFDLVHARDLDPRFGDTLLRMQGVNEGPALTYWHEGLLMAMEADKHARIRRLLHGSFTPTQVAKVRPVMRHVAEELTDDLIEAGTADFVPTFADQYPVRIFAYMMGIPEEDIPQFSEWSTDLGLIFAMPIHPVLPRVDAAIEGLFAYAAELIAKRRGDPGEDLVSQMLAAEEEGEKLSGEELQWQVLNMIFSGHDSSRHEMAITMALFCDSPDQWSQLRERPDLAPNAAEEAVRLRPTIAQTTRTVRGAFVYDDVAFPDGTSFVLRSDCANRDPAVFDDPAAFDITRDNADRQLSFGGGRTFCMGASLARAELEEALTVLSDRIATIRPEGEATWRPASSGIQGPEQLPVTVTAA